MHCLLILPRGTLPTSLTHLGICALSNWRLSQIQILNQNPVDDFLTDWGSDVRMTKLPRCGVP
jgi:hypothetical protein